MDLNTLLSPQMAIFGSPLSFAVLIAITILLFWQGLTAPKKVQEVRDRLEDFVQEADILPDGQSRKSFASRTVLPLLRRLLRLLGRFAPKRNMEAMRKMLVLAGDPGALTALDFFGLRMFVALLLGAICILALTRVMPPFKAFFLALPVGAIGSYMPLWWLRGRMKRRKKEISRALPDALDMLTIGVEAGLAFESALLRVGERWNNALTREFRRVVIEMRVGTPRDEALTRITERTDVEELHMFVAILVQANQLGLSIAEVLHTQAAQMRMKRRQKAEELARKASIKMLLPLVFLVFPTIMVVVLGPAIPLVVDMVKSMSGVLGK
jgi:tight adherence protein C